MWVRDAIRVREREELSPGRLDPNLTRPGPSAILLVEDARPESPGDFGGRVARVAIDDDDFLQRERLGADGREAPLDSPCLVLRRNDDRHIGGMRGCVALARQSLVENHPKTLPSLRPRIIIASDDSR